MSFAAAPPEFHEIVPAFPLSGRLVSAAPHGSGHINETYAAVCADGAGTRRYIFQKINHRIFKDVPGLMDNVRRVTAHLAAKVHGRRSPLELRRDRHHRDVHRYVGHLERQLLDLLPEHC